MALEQYSHETSDYNDTLRSGLESQDSLENKTLTREGLDEIKFDIGLNTHRNDIASTFEGSLHDNMHAMEKIATYNASKNEQVTHTLLPEEIIVDGHTIRHINDIV